MEIATVGIQFSGVENSDLIDFSSSDTLLAYDLVIFDPAVVLASYAKSKIISGKPAYDEERSKIIRKVLCQRQIEFKEMLEHGKFIISIVRPPQEYYMYNEENKLVKMNAINVLHMPGLKTVELSGKKMVFNGDDALKEFWERNKRNFARHLAYIDKPVGSPFLFIKDTDHILASLYSIENGFVLLIPLLDLSPKAGKIHEVVCKEFVESAIDLFLASKHDIGAYDLPEWTNNYMLPGEEVVHQKVDDLLKDRITIEYKIDELNKNLKEYDTSKLLLTSSGDILQRRVIDILKDIGVDAQEGAPGRDDIIITFNDKPAVMEVKGTSKSAAEKHAAQLEKWVSEYYERHGIRPKGVLIVNAFCDKPLSERVEKPFPSQMIPYSKAREHCLLTTTQLLGIYFEVKSNQSKNKELIESLFNTIGVYKDFQDYSKFITTSDEPEKENNKEVGQ